LTLDAPRIVYGPAPPEPSYSATNVYDMIWALIGDDVYPEPDEEARIFMVFSPPSTLYDDLSADAAHFDDDRPDLLSPDIIFVGWVDYGPLDQVTGAFSHELAETISDPEPSSGWTVSGSSASQSEIGDVCNQLGMVNGYQVKAYYSERLKACVIPAPRISRGVTLSTPSVKGTGPWRRGLGGGRAQTTKKSRCYSGTYGWSTMQAPLRVTVAATPLGFDIPIFSWTVNGQAFISGKGLQTVTIDSSPNLDPFHLITDVGPVSVDLMVSGGGNSIAIDVPASAPGVAIDIACSVSEWNVPAGYGLTAQDDTGTNVAGTVRIMDQRFQDDFNRCVQEAKIFARKLYNEKVVPQIDPGDPPPPWVEREFRAVSAELRDQQREAEFLAHFVANIDPELAERLRGLAQALVGVVELPRLAVGHRNATVSEPA
jgi:hypothetical protein